MIFCRPTVSFDNLKTSARHTINSSLKLNWRYFSHAFMIAFLGSEITVDLLATINPHNFSIGLLSGEQATWSRSLIFCLSKFFVIEALCIAALSCGKYILLPIDERSFFSEDLFDDLLKIQALYIYIYIYIYIPKQKYKTTLKNEEKVIVYSFWTEFT